MDPWTLSSVTMALQNFSLSSNLPGLYVHIPFCRTKCPYCSFFSVTDLAFVDEFLKALYLEMETVRDTFPKFDTLYIGGGSPSVLSPGRFRELMKAINEKFHIFPKAEITVEVNPGDGDDSFFEALQSSGVNRIILGVQSFSPSALSFLRRRHSVDQALKTIYRARQAGFWNIGIDLIYGIPGQTLKQWLDTLDQALAFSPEHLSCYELTIEPHTPLARQQAQRKIPFPGKRRQYELFMATAEKLEKTGYFHYEVSNFARSSQWISRHNHKYWDHTEYLGLGPSAHSFVQNRRWWNGASLSDYIMKLKTRRSPIEGLETLSLEELRLEALALAFRTKKGLDFSDFFRKYYSDVWKEKGPMLMRLAEEGLLTIEDNRVFPTRRGLAVADWLALI